MGIVYEAHDPSLRRTIALKTFHLSFAVSPEKYQAFEQRFFAEAQIAARLSHPGIVAVHDVGCDPEIGTLYIALAYLKGRTLQEVIKDGVPLGWRQALGITLRVAEALHYAHSQQVVHRDIKPANIMLLPSGDPKILDFGIAKMEARSHLTIDCQVFGTPLFMAPEQALGNKPDGRADLFSLGAIAYSLLTGRLAFEAPSIPATVRRVLEEDPEPPSHIVADLPRGLDEVIARALAKSPEDRYSCGRELVEDIQALLEEPRTGGGKLAEPVLLEVDALPTPSAHPVLDLDAELAALVSSPAAPRDAAPAGSLRGRSRPSLLVIPTVLAVLGVCYLAWHGLTPAGGVQVGPAPAGPSEAADDPAPRTPSWPHGPATQPNDTLSVGVPARLRIDFEHPLRSGRLRLWIDDEMVLQQELGSRGKATPPGIELRKGRLSGEIAVKPGKHTVRAEVHWDDNHRQQTLSGSFTSGASCRLELNLGRFRKNLSAAWK